MAEQSVYDAIARSMPLRARDPDNAPTTGKGTRLTENYYMGDFRSSCDLWPWEDEVFIHIWNLAANLEKIRAAAKTKGLGTISINSGARSRYFNDVVMPRGDCGGKKYNSARNSQHKKGKAADISVVGGSARIAELARVIEKLIAAGEIPNGGLGIYPSFVHYDFRGVEARW